MNTRSYQDDFQNSTLSISGLMDSIVLVISGGQGWLPSTDALDRVGADAFIIMESGLSAIDLKIYGKTLTRNNDICLVLETFSSIEDGHIGWTLDGKKVTDYLGFYWKDSGYFLVIPFKALRSIFIEYLTKFYKNCQIFDTQTDLKGHIYRSQAILVPWKTLKILLERHNIHFFYGRHV